MSRIEIAGQCGHQVAPEPHTFGRGQARQRRLAQTCCRECAEARLRARVTRYTHIDGTPWSADEREAYIDRHLTGGLGYRKYPPRHPQETGENA